MPEISLKYPYAQPVPLASGSRPPAVQPQNQADSTRQGSTLRCGELLGVADRAGCADSVRAAVKAKLGEPVKRPWQAARHAFTLAMILRDEQDWDGSFQALVGRVSDPERLREAARWLSDPAPKRASELYALAIEALIAKKNKRGYRDAVKVLVEAKPSYDAVGRDEFASFVARLRDQHKQKRNFLAALDASL